MKNVKLTVEYLGTNYYGWQIQKGLPTVQGILKEKIERILNHKINLIGASRTDAGVHAFGQVANFKTEKELDLKVFVRGVNSLLPPDIKIVEAEFVDENFHARYSAKGKTYLYRIYTREIPSPFEYKRAWLFCRKLNVEKMIEASKHLIGVHDFTSFSKGIPDSPVREVKKIEFEQKEDLIEIVFEGKSFLRHMVRIMVAVLVEVGKGNLKPDDVLEIREARDRKKAPFLAPPDGLYLVKVHY